MFDVFVPKAGSMAADIVAPGSAIVASHERADSLSGDGKVLCYYEGNLYGAINLQSFAERLLVASLRARDKCRTVAMGIFSEDELAVAGYYDLKERRLMVTDSGALKGWLGEELYKGLGQDPRLVQAHV
jgi:hypothetical protein